MATTNIRIKLVIDTEANKVVFAEASKDFVDFLFFLLALPIGTVVNFLTSESMVGSIGNLFTSLANLNETYLAHSIHKDVLLNPMIFSFSAFTNMPLPISRSLSVSGNQFIENSTTVNDNSTAVHVTLPNGNIASQGYVKEMVTYMVSDDLSVTPLSSMSIISLTNKCNASKLEERKVDIGTKEALELLKISFQSTTVLTDVFLRQLVKSKGHEVEDRIIRQLSQELEERNEEVDRVTGLNKALITKERRSNEELQHARKELIKVFQTLPGGTNVGIKKMGEIEPIPFKVACKRKYGADKDWEVKFLELVSLWQSNIMDSTWRPWKVILKDGIHQDMQEVVDKDDIMLNQLRSEWGDGVYNVVVKALMEMNEYTSSGRHPVVELWNFKEGRKASLKEAIQCSKRRRATIQLQNCGTLKRIGKLL